MSRVEEAKKNSNWQQHSHPTKVLTLVSSTRAHLIFNNHTSEIRVPYLRDEQTTPPSNSPTPRMKSGGPFSNHCQSVFRVGSADSVRARVCVSELTFSPSVEWRSWLPVLFLTRPLGGAFSGSISVVAAWRAVVSAPPPLQSRI